MPDNMETTSQVGNVPVLKKRRRAVRACLSCRSRKVRCDVARSGPPCMNCSLDGIDCLVKDRKPKASARHGTKTASREEQQSSASPDGGDEYVPEHVHPAEQVNTTEFDTGLELLNPSQTIVNDATFESGAIEDQVMDLMFFQNAESPTDQLRSLNYSAVDFAEPGAFMPQDDWIAECVRDHDAKLADTGCVEAPCTGPRRTTHKNSVFYTYYPFITLDNLSSCSPHDVQFLEAEGCFHLPTRPIMDQIVRQYFLHVHPLLPILNEGDFWEMYHTKPSGASSNISLLVLQAVMFVSCNFVNWSPESTRSVGYKNTRGLRATFYRRAKLLYDFGAESSSVAIAQAALLLSYWTPPALTQLRSNTVWLSVAIESAKNAEAPYYATLPASSKHGSPEERAEAKQNNLLKRLWWCCVIRDRILPLGLRRGIQITRAHFDFGKHQPLGLMDLDDEVHRSIVYNADAKRELIRVLAHVLDLCVILTDVLLLVFPIDGALGARKQAAISMSPSEDAKIRSNKKALVHWYTAAVTTSATAVDEGAEINWNKHDSVILYTHLMFTYYHTARMALYNHELQHHLSPVAENSPIDAHKLRETRDAIQNACSNITENIRGLNKRHLTRWLPISAAAYVAFPLALHVLNNHLSSRGNHQAPSSETLIEVMMTLHAQYDGVHWVAKLVRQLVELVQNDSALPAGGSVANWAELLTFKPRTYLRLAVAMDLCMSSGRVPEQKDFPARLESNLLSRVLERPHAPKRINDRSSMTGCDASWVAGEDSALGADFFDPEVPRDREDSAPRVLSAVDGEGADDRQLFPEDVSRGQDHTPHTNFNAEMGFVDVTGSFPEGNSSFFDPVLADMAGMGDGSPGDGLSGGVGMEVDYAAALSV